MSLILETTRTDGSIVVTALEQSHVSITAAPGEQFRIIDANGQLVADFDALRVGNDLHLEATADNITLDICGFFGEDSDDLSCSLILPEGQTVAATELTPLMLAAAPASSTDDGKAAPADEAAGGSQLSGTTLAIGAGVAVLAAAASGGGSSSSSTETAPAAPTNLDIEGDDKTIDDAELAGGVMITGNAQAGSTVNVTLGTATATTTAAADGTFSVTIPVNDVPANGTYDVVATATNTVGTSDAATLSDVIIARTPPPAAPTGVDIEGADNVIDGTEAADGVTVTGQAEAGSTVSISWGTATATAVTGGDGNFSATIANTDVPANGTYDLSATASNAGGSSPATTISNVQAASNTPVTPSNLDIEGDDTIIDATEAADGVTISGNAEAGSTVAVSWGGHSQNATADASGTYTTTVALADLPLDGASQISVTSSNVTGTSAAETLDVTMSRGAGGSGTGATVDGNTTVQSAGNITGTGANDVLVGGAGGEVRNSDFDFWDIATTANVLNPTTFGGVDFISFQGANGGTANPDMGWTMSFGNTAPAGTTPVIGAVGNNQYDQNQPNIDPGFGEIELFRVPATNNGDYSWESVNSSLSGGGGLKQDVLTENGQNYSLTLNYDAPTALATAGTSVQISWGGSVIGFFDATQGGGTGAWIVDGGNGLAAPTATSPGQWTFDNLAGSAGTTELSIVTYESYGAGPSPTQFNDGIGLRFTSIDLATAAPDGTETIDGGAGSDLIYGQAGDDTLTGGAGSDTFVYTMTSHNNADVVTDFTVGEDRIMLVDARDTVSTDSLLPGDGSLATETPRSYLNLSTADFVAANGQEVVVSDNGGNLMLTFSDANDNAIGSVTLTGVTAATYLGADNLASLNNVRNAGILDWTNDGFNTGLI